MISILIAIVVAALAYALCVALGLPTIVGIIAAVLVLLAGAPAGLRGRGSSAYVATGGQPRRNRDGARCSSHSAPSTDSASAKSRPTRIARSRARSS